MPKRSWYTQHYKTYRITCDQGPIRKMYPFNMAMLFKLDTLEHHKFLPKVAPRTPQVLT